MSITCGAYALLKPFASVFDFADFELTGITQDSRSVKQGYAFVVCAGGAQYVTQAIKQGARLLIADVTTPIKTDRIPVVYLTNLPAQLAHIALRFYDNPSTKLEIIGITGTNGKTSVSHYVAQLSTMLGTPCALIGTLGNGCLPDLSPTLHTTPDVFKVQQLLAEFVAKGITRVAMEVSSHGLQQGRVAGVQFKVAVLTNLTRDHLDYHGDMQSYAKAKRILFETSSLQGAIVNIDDAFGQQLQKDFGHALTMYGISLAGRAAADIRINNLTAADRGYQIEMVSPWGEATLEIPLLGHFNIGNVLSALGALCLLGEPLPQLANCTANLLAVAGRMQSLQVQDKPLVVVDYAHTPDALAKALQNLAGARRGKLWCVFGCGGDRDSGKRPQMLAAAQRYADRIVVTSDNPRFEEPQLIIEDILSKTEQRSDIMVCVEREQAIAYAIANAERFDTILIAGKGHEDYQEIKGVRQHFNDLDIAQRLLTK